MKKDYVVTYLVKGEPGYMGTVLVDGRNKEEAKERIKAFVAREYFNHVKPELVNKDNLARRLENMTFRFGEVMTTIIDIRQ